MSERDEDDFDATLRAAFAARPEPAAGDLAARVMARAGSDPATRAAERDAFPSAPRAAMQSRPAEWIGALLAFAAVAVVVLIGAERFLALRASSSAYEAAVYSSATSSAGSSFSEVGLLLVVGVAALVGAIAYLAIAGSFGGEEDRLDLATW